MAPLTDFRVPLKKNITQALKQLLSEKHLYQYVTVDSSTYIDEVAKAVFQFEIIQKQGGISGKQLQSEDWKKHRGGGTRLVHEEWFPEIRSLQSNELMMGQEHNPLGTHVSFDLPSIRTTCNTCKTPEPFNPVHAQYLYLNSLQKSHGSKTDQVYLLSYECQGCQSSRQIIRFLVHRTANNLKLCGRDPIEFAGVPKEIPRKFSKYFCTALVAHQTGQNLCGIFMLRVFIEQYWRSIPVVSEVLEKYPQPRGEDLGRAYRSILHPKLKDGFPTLLEEYQNLSKAIHTANEDAAIFSQAKDSILRHFKGVDLFGFVDPPLIDDKAEVEAPAN